MSILIEGMKMPKDRAIIEIHPDGGYACTRYGFVIGKAIELPPHGRLIDADALADYIDLMMAQHARVDAFEMVQNAPSIIPADPEKEDT